ncbi:MAG TPA: nicotinamidase [Gemmatimonadales bacterium]|nr:nicotinamidase [Gemmatimonadales bacterium]
MTHDTSGYNRDRSALILVDLQPDFMPGGALPVAEGDVVLEPIRRLLERDPFALYVATQDWHPTGHVSFASSHPGRRPFDVIRVHGHEQTLWPDHCVQGTPGARLHPDLSWEQVSAIIRKGAEADTDSYSGFRNNWNAAGARPPTGLTGYLMERGIDSVFLCGLARDYCVKWSAEDAAAAGFTTAVLWDLTRPVDPSSDDRVRADLRAAKVEVIESERVLL